MRKTVERTRNEKAVETGSVVREKEKSVWVEHMTMALAGEIDEREHLR